MSPRPSKRTSGNGVSSSQWLYVKIHIPFLWVWKIGITGNLSRRTRENSQRVFGFWIPVAAIWIPCAYQLEQRILRQSSRFALTIFGKGGTELRPFWVGLLAAGLVYTLGIVKWSTVLLITAFFIFLIVSK